MDKTWPNRISEYLADDLCQDFSEHDFLLGRVPEFFPDFEDEE